MSDVWLDFVVRDWEPPGWSGDFFPSDLPADWRLAYFANEFRAVLLPVARWWRSADLADWAAQTPDDFRFYLELPPGGEGAMDPRGVQQQLAGRLAGVVTAAGGCRVWHDQGVACYHAEARTGGAITHPALTPGVDPCADPRAGRVWLEQTARRLGSGSALVILEAEHGRAEQLRQWWQLAWLMGLA